MIFYISDPFYYDCNFPFHRNIRIVIKKDVIFVYSNLVKVFLEPVLVKEVTLSNLVGLNTIYTFEASIIDDYISIHSIIIRAEIKTILILHSNGVEKKEVFEDRCTLMTDPVIFIILNVNDF